jgi:DMSO/TMAO reductase YedYZ molybdopterin-dependent catalytic subunit
MGRRKVEPSNPFEKQERRGHVEGDFHWPEVQLALRQVELPLEALRYDVTPVGLHYTLNHFDVPHLAANGYRLAVEGLVHEPLSLSLEALMALPRVTRRVTLECAGNGRAGMTPRYPSMPWMYGAASTAEWTGVRLSEVLAQAQLLPEAVEVVFFGADRGFDAGVEHFYGRSLTPAQALGDDVLLVFAMNGQPLLPQHGFPLRLIVPGWYGMASVKWLTRIVAIDHAFDGYQQMVGYHYRKFAGDPGVPVTFMRVKSLMLPPGIPDWYTRTRMVDRGRVELMGRAWSGDGVAVTRVEMAVDGAWRDARLDLSPAPYAWQAWRFDWDAAPGEHELMCRATDAAGNVQPVSAGWNTNGMGNNGCHRVQVFVR